MPTDLPMHGVCLPGKMLLSMMKGMLVVAFPTEEGAVDHHRQVADDIEAALQGHAAGSGGHLLTEKLPSVPAVGVTLSTAAALDKEQDPSVTALLTPRALTARVARTEAAARAKGDEITA